MRIHASGKLTIVAASRQALKKSRGLVQCCLYQLVVKICQQLLLALLKDGALSMTLSVGIYIKKKHQVVWITSSPSLG